MRRQARAVRLLETVGLGDRLDHKPDRLSGGEQQRVAIAVALANEPDVLLADEPTGELDSVTAAEIFGLLRRINHELGTTVVIVTHDALVSEQVGRTVAIRDGRTSTETVRRTELADDGGHRVVHEEFAVLDKAGRLQLPRAHVEALGLADRVRLRLVDDHVEIWPDAPRTTRRPTMTLTGSPLPAERPAVDTAMVRTVQLVREYPSGDSIVHALRGVDLAVGQGRLLAVRGRSGSGKTTLLNLLGGLDRPTSGEVYLDGEALSTLDEAALVEVRRTKIAFIFQAFGLIPVLSAAENVEVPLRLVRTDPAERGRRVQELLEHVGPRRARQAPSARVVRRGAATGRDRPGAGEPAQAPAGGRADRSAGLGDRPPDHADAADGRPGRRDHRGRGHPRPADARRRGRRHRAARRRTHLTGDLTGRIIGRTLPIGPARLSALARRPR